MNVCVVGLWHLGSVTAACLAQMGHRVVGLDSDPATILGLQRGQPPVFEPGLAELIATETRAGRLSFSSEASQALAEAEVVWITYDTPVDDDDVADVDGVLARVEALLPHVRSGAVVLISSQLIAGCTRRLQQKCDRAQPSRGIEFAYSPENLRLGKAISVFLEPDRIVVGANTERVQNVVTELLSPFKDRILWMSVESAEMTKHALNAFLAMCVSFANEVAAVCEQVGADAKQVEAGLKSEKRIGPFAYLSPGAAFAGGTLARDVQYLKVLAREHGQPGLLFTAIKDSNDRHRKWVQFRLQGRFGSLQGRRVCVLGLTYKPGTDTLRRSSSVELCRWLHEQGARVSAHDPRVTELPSELARVIELAASIEAALKGADAVVIATPWPEYQSLPAELVRSTISTPIVVDANRAAARTLDAAGIEYIAVGTPARTHA
ncbi:MAG TPA: nucleotide sugar dehydrogenase [Polyangiales bacterium]|nr:nucleotide sugar dehydrogenase [Polyangiales bacterium]